MTMDKLMFTFDRDRINEAGYLTDVFNRIIEKVDELVDEANERDPSTPSNQERVDAQLRIDANDNEYR